MLSELKNNEKVVGARQVRRAVTSGRAKTLFAARDADPALTAELVSLAEEHGVAVQWVDTMRELGRSCGIAVGAAVAASI